MLNFLDENIELVMKMTDEAFGHLPVITVEDLQNEWEKYRLLLGRWEFSSLPHALVLVEAVMEIPNDPVYYTETNGHVLSINIPAIKRFIAEIRKHVPEYQLLQLVGEIHMQKDPPDDIRSWYPSECDKNYLALSYKQRDLNPEAPFLTGVAGAMEGGKTGYAFYRMVKKEDEYFIRPVDWPEGGSDDQSKG